MNEHLVIFRRVLFACKSLRIILLSRVFTSFIITNSSLRRREGKIHYRDNLQQRDCEFTRLSLIVKWYEIVGKFEPCSSFSRKLLELSERVTQQNAGWNAGGRIIIFSNCLSIQTLEYWKQFPSPQI